MYIELFVFLYCYFNIYGVCSDTTHFISDIGVLILCINFTGNFKQPAFGFIDYSLIDFFKYFFFPTLFLLSFWYLSDMSVRPLRVVPQVPEALFTFVHIG